jgi:hypothetical protein
MIRNLDWSFINSFSGWLSAIGTLLAVIVSLWLTRQDSRIRLKVRVGIRKVLIERKVYQTPGDEPDFLIIAVTNIGRRVVTVVGLLWKNRLIRRTRFQFPGEAPLSAQIPVRLQDGDEANFTISMSALVKNGSAVFRPLVPRPRMLTIRFLRMMIRTSTGELVSAPLEKELRKRLLVFLNEGS